MIKARSHDKNGTPIALLGLSRLNVDRLMSGQPITIDLRDLDLPPIHVLLVGGETEKSLTMDLEKGGLLPPGTTASMAFDENGSPIVRE